MIAGVIGATGYAGAEVVRLLAGHPQVTGLVLGSVSFEGDRIENQYLNFQTAVSASLERPDKVIARSSVVFAALPHGVGEPYAQAAIKAGVSFIDLSADYRFDDDEATFAAWYGMPYRFPALREKSVYGLPEMNRAKIRALAQNGPVVVGNPGCYPTGASLGAMPALVRGVAGEGAIIIDAASGITGGGRELSRSFHYSECADSVGPYKTGSHRHTPEIARNFRLASGRDVPVIFTPHLAPMNRGILSTIYIPLADSWRVAPGTPGAVRPPNAAVEERTAKIRDMYAEYYRDEPFVRVLPPGAAAASGRVRQSNFCDISIHLDQSGSTLIVVTAIDNMMKGAAGQAVQNMNIILGYGEKEGLEHIPSLF